MIEENIKSEVVGVDISIESTTYAIVDVRGNIIAEDSFPTLSRMRTATGRLTSLRAEISRSCNSRTFTSVAVVSLLKRTHGQ